MALAPLLWVWAFGFYDDGFCGTSIPWAVAALVVGAPLGLIVWRTTRARRMPSSRSYRLTLALVAFVSCVAWIYYLADLAVDFIEVRGRHFVRHEGRDEELSCVGYPSLVVVLRV